MGEAISPRVRLFTLRVRLFQDRVTPCAHVGAKQCSHDIIDNGCLLSGRPHTFRPIHSGYLDKSQLSFYWTEQTTFTCKLKCQELYGLKKNILIKYVCCFDRTYCKCSPQFSQILTIYRKKRLRYIYVLDIQATVHCSVQGVPEKTLVCV